MKGRTLWPPLHGSYGYPYERLNSSRSPTTIRIAFFVVGGQGGGGSGKKVEQVDALGQILGYPGKGSHIDEQQGAAADSEAGEHAGDGAGQEGDGPRHQKNSALTPP